MKKMQAEITHHAQRFKKIVHAFFNSKNEQLRKDADRALRQVCPLPTPLPLLRSTLHNRITYIYIYIFFPFPFFSFSFFLPVAVSRPQASLHSMFQRLTKLPARQW